MEEETDATEASQSELIKTLGAATKWDVLFAMSMCNSTVWAASENEYGNWFGAVWLVLAIIWGWVGAAARLR